MIHYQCPECGGISAEPGVCVIEGCTAYGKELRECNCQDGKHGENKDATE